MKYLIFGNGYLGNAFLGFLGKDAVIAEGRVESTADAAKKIKKYKPEVVLNCIGKTGVPNIDWCENHKMETLFANTIIPVMLAQAADSSGVFFAHISSGCIYQGDHGGKGFSEDDAPNFSNSFYARTKIWAEQMLNEFPALQLRARMPLDGSRSARNLITKLISYQKIISVPNSISVLDDFMIAAKKLIDKRKTGVYNVTNPGSITHDEILDMYKAIVDPKFTYELFLVEDLNKVVKTPRSNCVLSTKKLEGEGIMMPSVKEAVRAALMKYKVA